MSEQLIEVSSLKIRITKCSFVSFWYNTEVGKIFNVSDISSRDYYTVENGSTKGILRIDAEIITS